jgi:hypothetical protein
MDTDVTDLTTHSSHQIVCLKLPTDPKKAADANQVVLGWLKADVSTLQAFLMLEVKCPLWQ